jgi:diguanylate cyclase (GGDEF)-like protein
LTETNRLRLWSKLETYAHVVATSRAFSDLDAKIGLIAKRGPAWIQVGGANALSGLPPESPDTCLQNAGVLWESDSLLVRLSDFDDVIAIARPSANVPVGDRAAFQERLVELLERQVEQSSDRHAAMTDSLTALPNRAAFEAKLREALTRWAKPTGNGAVDGGIPYGVWLVLYDLDNFKQANDTFGHEYGDLLLQSFAWQFASSAKDQMDGYSLSGTVARIGGEEFALLLSGTLLEADVHAIADGIRAGIEVAKIPRREHWARLKQLYGPEIELQRHIGQDPMTASVGWAGVYDLPGTARAELPSAERLLKTEADVAMYSSKEYGRNQTRSFRSVRRAYGKVLEHTSVPNITAIDIGSSAGVELGDLFEVFDPKFIGDEVFTVRGPRSDKKLGVYPRIATGRLRVSEPVQREVSFCTPNQSEKAGPFVAKSRVFLYDDLTKTHACKLDLVSLAFAEEKLAEQIELGRRLVAIVFRVRSGSGAEVPYREPVADRLLSGLADGVVNDTMTVLLRVETAPSEIALVFVGPSVTDAITECRSTVDRISRLQVGRDLSMGIFGSDQALGQHTRTAFSAKFALRYAAAAARLHESSTTWSQVSDKTPVALINATLATVGIFSALALASALIEDGVIDREMDQTIGAAAIESPSIQDNARDFLVSVADRLSDERASPRSREIAALLNARLFGYMAMLESLNTIAAAGEPSHAIRGALFLARVEAFREQMADPRLRNDTVAVSETEISVPEQATALAEELKEILKLSDLGGRMRTELEQVVSEFTGTGIEFPKNDLEGRR